MQSELLQLVSDTLSFLDVDTRAYQDKPVPSRPVKVEPKKAAPPPPQPQSHTPPKLGSSPLQKQAPPKQDTPLIFSTIQKHLPHIRLVEKIPQMHQVALIVFEKDDLLFLKNLAKAIQDRICPVKLLDGEKLDRIKDWDIFTLVISQRELPVNQKIILAPITTYQNNVEEKKMLWSTICQHLLPKSS